MFVFLEFFSVFEDPVFGVLDCFKVGEWFVVECVVAVAPVWVFVVGSAPVFRVVVAITLLPR